MLDDKIMSAVDYRLKGGLAFEELTYLLNIVVSSGLTIGIDITIFNPTLDPTGEMAKKLVKYISNGLTNLV